MSKERAAEHAAYEAIGIELCEVACVSPEGLYIEGPCTVEHLRIIADVYHRDIGANTQAIPLNPDSI